MRSTLEGSRASSFLAALGVVGCLCSVATPQITTYDGSALPSEATPPWRYTGSGITETDGASITPEGILEVYTRPDQRVRWASESQDGFGGVDPQSGFTVEIRIQILRSTFAERAFDFEASTGDGSPEGNRYFIAIAQRGVYWHIGNAVFEPIATDIDNADGFHTFRLAVTAEGICSIFRDGQFLGSKEAAHNVDMRLGAQGPYMQFGEGAGTSEADALIDYVSFDLSGPHSPALGFVFESFSSGANLSLVGDAKLASDALRLTTDGVRETKGARSGFWRAGCR